MSNSNPRALPAAAAGGRVLLALLTGGWLAGCEMNAKVALPDVPAKLFVTCFLAPHQDSLRVRVSRTLPLGTVSSAQTRDLGVAGATVTLTTNGRTVTLPATRTLGNYALSARELPLLAGGTYALSVVASGYPSAAATCVIPTDRNQTLTVRLDSLARTGVAEHFDYTVVASWQANPAVATYFHAYAERPFQIITTNGRRDTAYSATVLSLSGSIAPQEGYARGQDRPDGRLVRQGPFLARSGTSTGAGANTGPARRVDVYLLTTDRAYHDYHRTLLQNASVGNNPFAEPVLVFSNVTGGLGVMAGYQQTRVSVQY